MSDSLNRLENLMSDLEEEPLLALVKQLVEEDVDPISIVEACRKGMDEVGKRFSEGEYYLSELIMSAEVFQGAMKILEPKLSAVPDAGLITKVVFGTVKGDVHDIGKDIVVTMLRCNGFEVYDVGIDTPPQVFVDKVRETGAKIVGLSGLLTVAFDSMEETINAMKDAGLDVKTMIGGGMTDEAVRAKVGADAVGYNAMEAVNLAKEFSELR